MPRQNVSGNSVLKNLEYEHKMAVLKNLEYQHKGATRFLLRQYKYRYKQLLVLSTPSYEPLLVAAAVVLLCADS
jgi:hypothetical protein